MAHELLFYTAGGAGLLALCGLGYCLLGLWSARSVLRTNREAQPAFLPPVSILKPLRGTDPQMYEAFRSHCLQDYPEYELIFGVSLADDPAIELVKRLQQEFPDAAITAAGQATPCGPRRIRLVFCDDVLGTNVKVSNLVQMLPHAQYDHLLVNDSDIRVPRDYLRRIMPIFSDERTGMVTALYRGIPGPTLGSKLEALGIATDFIPGVLVARQIENGLHFGLGSTLAFTRRALAAIGGFQPLLDYLADDYELGHRISRAGFRVVLSDVVVDTFLPAYTFRSYWKHQLRWLRTIRTSRQGGYLGLVLTHSLPWAVLALLLSQGAGWAWMLLGFVAAGRLAVALRVGIGVLNDSAVLRFLWLIPVRDMLALGLWVCGLGGNTVLWRGDLFGIKRGKLFRMES